MLARHGSSIDSLTYGLGREDAVVAFGDQGKVWNSPYQAGCDRAVTVTTHAMTGGAKLLEEFSARHGRSLGRLAACRRYQRDNRDRDYGDVVSHGDVQILRALIMTETELNAIAARAIKSDTRRRRPRALR